MPDACDLFFVFIFCLLRVCFLLLNISVSSWILSRSPHNSDDGPSMEPGNLKRSPYGISNYSDDDYEEWGLKKRTRWSNYDFDYNDHAWANKGFDQNGKRTGGSIVGVPVKRTRWSNFEEGGYGWGPSHEKREKDSNNEWWTKKFWIGK